ncbi:glucose-1-phosphatase [Rodentibacter ratti]|uniref:Glucose-1-phosphatase n=1 Tax=Rodentibacter ratti TaxID=1906745 RepID=A0A1V3KYV9_9PAST|nr:histidine-type phosphatase [Rodentibacter ratti]OOF82867.1 glucose-1-phosphatase [Rodentibacter ratti]
MNEAGASGQDNLSLNDYRLDKVLIFSRHGLRSPVEKDPQEMAKYTPYPWAKWDVPSGHLTPKGTILETYFGQYLGQWLKQNGLLSAERCATGEGIFAYANSVQRTIATGQAIIAGAFAGCNVPLQYQGEVGDEKDPIFHAQAKSLDIALIEFAKKNVDLTALQQKLAPNYALLSDLIDYKNSPNCLQKEECDLGGKQGEYRVEEGKSVRITGSISTAKKIVSSLLLAHYVGKSPSEIAHGNIDSKQKWQAINEIKNEYYRILFKNNRELAQNVAYPLLQFIQQQLNSENKISLLVGYDSNIVALLAALGVKPYELENSLENIPIGGKLMFEVWKHNVSGKLKFRLEYIYQTTEQLIHLTPLSLSTPPNRTRLILADCSPDDEGLCDYEHFQQVLQDSLKLKTEKR